MAISHYFQFLDMSTCPYIFLIVNSMSDIIKDIERAINGKNNVDASVIKFIKDTNFCELIDNNKFVEKKYTRDKLVDTKNAVVYIIYWAKDAYSPPHNHPDGGCILKLLNGKLCETIYDLINNRAVRKNDGVLLTTDYISIKYGNELHSVMAIDNTVSIHMYFPGDYTPTFFGCCDNA